MPSDLEPSDISSSTHARGLLHVGRPNLGPREVFDSYIDRIYESGWLTNNGPLVREFERAVARRLGVDHCVAMCNGTVALEIAVRALNLTGEVIVPSFTFVATAHALSWQGIEVVFADIDAETHNLDPRSVEAAITPRTTGIIGVHLWGRAAPVNELQAIADLHGIALLFDAAHAFDCTHDGVHIGNSGRAEILSFHATKFFNTFEGGAIVTNDNELAAQARLMRNFGFAGYDNVIYPGTNGKMTEVAAAMGLTNLVVVDHIVEGNHRTYERYAAALDGVTGVSLVSPPAAERTNHQYVVAMVDAGEMVRDLVLTALHERGVLARKYFWPGVHRMQPYATRQDVGVHLPATVWVADRILILPGGPSLSADDVAEVCTIIGDALETVHHNRGSAL